MYVLARLDATPLAARQRLLTHSQGRPLRGMGYESLEL